MGSNYEMLAAKLISLLNGDILPPPTFWDLEHHEQRIAIAVHETTGMTPEHWAKLDRPSREPWIEKTISAIKTRNKSSNARPEKRSDLGVSTTNNSETGAGIPDVDKGLAQYSLGTLLKELIRYQGAYDANMANVALTRAKLGPVAAERDRIQAEILKWRPEPTRMPGIGRIELLCDERFGTGINVESVRRLRAEICNRHGLDLGVADVLALNEAADLLSSRAEEGDDSPGGAMSGTIIEVFVSHSSKDALIAQALVDLLRAALNLPPDAIRCATVPGFKLPVGADTDEHLRREICESRSFIGLITEVSFESAYVLFELGARWGANKAMAPLLAAGTASNVLRGPIGGKNALSCDSPADLHQLIDDIGRELDRTPVKAASYSDKIERLVGVSETVRSKRAAFESNDGVGAQSGKQHENQSEELSRDGMRYPISISHRDSAEDRQFTELRRRGSRECGPKLQVIYDDFVARWWPTAASKDPAAIRQYATDFYERLRDFINLENAKVLHEGCWKTLVKVRDKAQAWSGHYDSVSLSHGTKLLFEVEKLATDFPAEADNLV